MTPVESVARLKGTVQCQLRGVVVGFFASFLEVGACGLVIAAVSDSSAIVASSVPDGNGNCRAFAVVVVSVSLGCGAAGAFVVLVMTVQVFASRGAAAAVFVVRAVALAPLCRELSVVSSRLCVQVGL